MNKYRKYGFITLLFTAVGCQIGGGFNGIWLITIDSEDPEYEDDCSSWNDYGDTGSDYEYTGDQSTVVEIDVSGGVSTVVLNDIALTGTADSTQLEASREWGTRYTNGQYWEEDNYKYELELLREGALVQGEFEIVSTERASDEDDSWKCTQVMDVEGDRAYK